MILTNANGQVFWAKRKEQTAWQFPQGGIQEGETPQQALYRELYEEIGLNASIVKILAESKNWLKYKLPEKYIKSTEQTIFVGQKQKWFLLYANEVDDKIKFNTTTKPEFDQWEWVSYWYPLAHIIEFKQATYKTILNEFAPYRLNLKQTHAI